MWQHKFTCGFLEYSSSLKDAQADLAKAQGIILLDGKLTLDSARFSKADKKDFGLSSTCRDKGLSFFKEATNLGNFEGFLQNKGF